VVTLCLNMCLWMEEGMRMGEELGEEGGRDSRGIGERGSAGEAETTVFNTQEGIILLCYLIIRSSERREKRGLKDTES
jgi:hypothetical protein